ncbi:MAG: leucine--tRNA ligase [Salinarchaeum sp.]
MVRRYDHGQVREFWQHAWERESVYELPADATDPTYVLGMFPYTSGSLHMGHVRNYAVTDAYARYRRMQGDDVLHPMGWDAFGLPAENAALKRMSDPESWTRACIERMREDMEAMGLGYDWSREITTCEPGYYRWNQWLFLQLYEAGLVEYKAAAVNWCPDCETTLADAQVDTVDGEEVCWRCGTPVRRRERDQWFFTITDYADELYDGLDELDGWQEGVRERQRNWIGRQEGATVAFEVPGYGHLDVFTTRVDTVYGASYVAVSPSHDLAADIETTAALQDPSADTSVGVDTGYEAIHPLTGERVPVYAAAYVLDDVGTGAVMGVPAHNDRDHAFGLAQDLPIKQVIEPIEGEVGLPHEPYTDDGMLVESGEYSGFASAAARERLIEDHEAIEEHVTYRLRDWLISRQRYWGTPIPVVHCETCGRVPVSEEDLPIELPEFVQTTGNPLAENDSFVETTCPECGGPARRETDTMDTFVDSSWYFLRFLSPEYDDGPFDPAVANELLPVDVYVGGEEHAVLHLLYIRFFTRALADLGLLDVREPVEELVGLGTVLYDGEKMSKSKGNAIAPHEYGPETTRLFVLAAAHPEQDFEWTAKDIGEVYDIQQALYRMVVEFDDGTVTTRTERRPPDAYVDSEIDRTVAAVTEEFEAFRFHQAIGELQALARLLRRYREYIVPNVAVYRRGLDVLARLIAPLAPHLGEELYSHAQGGELVVEADWPTPDGTVTAFEQERALVDSTIEDVREIVDVVGIEDPTAIEVVVAEDWKYTVYDLVTTADTDEAVVGQAIDAVGEHAADYAATLRDRAPGLDPVLDPEQEQTVLEEAAWLLEDEFDAAVTVRQADATDTLADRAAPGKPAIRIQEE